MALTSLTGISGTPQQTAIQNASDRLQAALASITNGTTQNFGDITELSQASQFQASNAALNTASTNLTEALTLTQIASGGIGGIQKIVANMQTLATQAASPMLNADNRKQLNQQFQQLSSEVDGIASNTSFNGQTLLDGSVSGANALSMDTLLGQSASNSSDSQLSIPDLSTNSLFNGQSLNISSSADANQALIALSEAAQQLSDTQANVSSYPLDYALANVDSALKNQEAALSNLNNTDLAAAATQSSLDSVQQNSVIALAAQTNNLSPALLQLVS